MFARLALLAFMLAPATTGCDAQAQVPEPAPVTAGPARDIVLAPGDRMLVDLDGATDPAQVDQTVGLILPGGQPVQLSARLGIAEGRAVADVVTGRRSDPIDAYQGGALVADGIVPAVVVWPEADEVASIRVTSTEGAVIRAGADTRQTWIPSVPLGPPR